MADTPLEELIERAIESRLRDLFTAGVGTVVSYDASAQRADVRLGMRRWAPSAEGAPVALEVPILPSVPVLLPRTGSAIVTFPVPAGTRGLVIFLDVPAGQWIRTGEVSDPDDLRLHHPTSAVFIPGVYPDPESTAQGSVDAWVVEAPEIHLGHPAALHVAIAELVATELSAIQTTLSTANAPSGGGPVTYGTPYSPGDVASTLVKVRE